MAVFGRRSARQRLRSAARESLTIPAFSAPVDCSAWVLGGLWPVELATLTPETAPLAEYLSADLQRIADSANGKLHAIGQSGLAGQARQAAEARIINVARAFAVLRVESTVRQLHKEALEFRAEYFSLTAGAAPAGPNAPVAPPAPAGQFPAPAEPSAPIVPPAPDVQFPAPQSGRYEGPEPARHRRAAPPVIEPPVVEPPIVQPAVVEPAVAEPTPSPPPPAPVVVLPPEPAPPVASPAPPVAEVVEVADLIPAPPAPPAVVVIDSTEPVEAPPAAPPAGSEPAPPPHTEAPVAEPEGQRLQRLLGFVARQQPGLRWAIGTTADGQTVLVTDLASGWVPSGIDLPAGVRLVEPGRRTGNLAALLGSTTATATYAPGDRLGWASDFGSTETSVQARELPQIDDLGWQLAEATHWREDLPRMANTLAKAGAAGTGVIDAEIDLLRVHLDTMQYQLLGQYRDVDAALLLNCMLLAATEAIATGDQVSANYHYSWFRVLSTPPVNDWNPRS